MHQKGISTAMPTAACGINCDVCRLNVLGVCISCGSGISKEGSEKIAVQKKLFGQPCPILACAHTNHLEYCMRDCDLFPCENFETSSYPFGDDFLSMQKRRLAEAKMKRISVDPISGGKITVPSTHWDSLQQKDPEEICRLALAQLETSGEIRLRVLNTDLFINIQERLIQLKFQGQFNPVENSLLELIVVIYLLHITPAPLRHEIVGVKDLKSAHFFQGPHELDTEPLLARFGRKANEFSKIAKSLGGRTVTQADVGYVFSPLPKVLLYYFLWEGDEEFEPRISILFDRSIEDHFPADFIWALVRYVSGALLSY